MPLQQGSSSKVISADISELIHHGNKQRSHKQIVAIALAVARKMKSRHSAAKVKQKRNEEAGEMTADSEVRGG